MNKETADLSENNFKSSGLARVIENALNDRNNRKAFFIIHDLRCQSDKKTYSFIADQLNKKGLKTRRGHKYQKASIKQLYDRFLKYYDTSKNKFKEGIIDIKSKTASDFGYLTITKIGDVRIETNFTPFKPFDFINTKDDNFEVSFLKTITPDIRSAKNKIVIGNFFLKPLSLDEERTFDKDEYFQLLEEAIGRKSKQFNYIRCLQIPYGIWAELEHNEIKINPSLPLESLIITLKIIPKSIEEHIYRCCKNKTLESRFELHIIRRHTTYNTFATIDTKTLFEEEYSFNKYGFASPSYIKVMRGKGNDDLLKYIDEKEETLEVLIGKREAKSKEIVDPHFKTLTSPYLYLGMRDIINSVGKKDEMEINIYKFYSMLKKEYGDMPLSISTKELETKILKILKIIDTPGVLEKVMFHRKEEQPM